MVSAALRKPPKIRTDDNPVEVKVADVDISLPIKPVGVTKKGEMELPETIAEVGWYRFGANPSWRTGTTVLASHVDTRAEGLGPFARLSEVKEGAEVTVTDKSGDKFSIPSGQGHEDGQEEGAAGLTSSTRAATPGWS